MFDEFKNAFNRYNNGHVQLIIINVAVFLVMAVIYVFSKMAQHGEIFEAVLGQVALPSSFSRFITHPWTLITHAFVHDLGGILHILFNMLALYWFGKLIIEYLGNDKFIALYVLGFLAGATFYLLVHNTIPFYMERQGLAYGASAAVNAIVIGAATLLPDYTIFLIFFGPVRLKWIAFIWVVVAFIGTVGANAGGDVAHLGGALMGFIYIKQLKAGVDWGNWITVTLDWFGGLFKPSSKVKVTYRKDEPKQGAFKAAAPGKPANKSFNKATQDEIDAILDKISDKGYESLTKDEKEKLFNASKK
jgi:membrane associated rhomboid family serine protease